MARSFVSHAGVDVVVVDGALLVLYALTLQRLSDTDSDERGAELRELLSMGEHWIGMLGIDLSCIDRACAEQFCAVVRDLAHGDVSTDELEKVRVRWFSHVREWSGEGIPEELIQAAVVGPLEELCRRFVAT